MLLFLHILSRFFSLSRLVFHPVGLGSDLLHCFCTVFVVQPLHNQCIYPGFAVCFHVLLNEMKASHEYLSKRSYPGIRY